MSINKEPEMVIEAPIGKYIKNNLRIYIVVCVFFAALFGYDGYLSKHEWSHRRSFYEKHVKDGRPDDTMVFNQKAPIFLAVAAVALGIRLWTIRNRKLIADENELTVSDKQKILYGSIEKIDKTLFKEKGFFVITYKNEKGSEANLKLSDRTYDNLAAVLDHLVAKIS
jgi:hypothetical protein